MKKGDITKKKIMDFIENNPGKSNTDIANFLGMTTVAILYHIQDLLKDNIIYKIGNTRSTRYFKREKDCNILVTNNFFEIVKNELLDEFDGLKELNIKDLLENILAYLKADGTWLYGFDAFIEKIKRENLGNIPDNDLLRKRLVRFLLSFFEEERKRRKNGFFDGTESIRLIMNSYKMKVSIDKLLFTMVTTLSHFGRLRCATELYYGKLDQNRYLLEKAINKSIDIIVEYIRNNNIDGVIYTPPTLKRKIQFRDVLKDLIEKRNINIKQIRCDKISSDIIHTLRPQKELKGYDRIINARKSVVVESIPNNMHNILILDDNFTTGATMNGIAEKIRANNYLGKITAITITGNFEYIPGITDQGEI